MSSHYYDEGPLAAGKKVLLAVPTYACPDTSLTFALARSREALSQADIQSALLILEGNCHVDDSRNQIAADFLASDCTDLMFLDADVCWEPEDLVRLCRRDQDIVGGVYPYRREGGDTMPVSMLDGECWDGLREVEGLPTGFMKIKRSVFEKMAPSRPWFYNKTTPTTLFFDRSAPNDDHIRYSGDIDFCRRWRALGGKVYAEEELRLGHAAKVIVRDSLAAYIRRSTGETLKYLIPRFRDAVETEGDYNELFKFAGNNFAADATVLALLAAMARKCTGPIIETGSGLSSIVMAAVSGQKVYSLEHSPQYGAQTYGWAKEAEPLDLAICHAPLTDELWYDLSKLELPARFSLGFCDGPPRKYGSRMRFCEVFGDRCTAIIVDDITSDNGFANKVRQWAEANGRTFQVLGRCALIQREEAQLQEAA